MLFFKYLVFSNSTHMSSSWLLTFVGRKYLTNIFRHLIERSFSDLGLQMLSHANICMRWWLFFMPKKSSYLSYLYHTHKFGNFQSIPRKLRIQLRFDLSRTNLDTFDKTQFLQLVNFLSILFIISSKSVLVLQLSIFDNLDMYQYYK